MIEIGIEKLQDRLQNALLMIDSHTVRAVLTDEYPGMSAFQRVETLVVPVLERIGTGWEKGEYSLSQVYMSGRICEEVVDLILPPTDPDRIQQPKMAIVTLEDYHVLGKRIVYSALRASGYELDNYGQMQAADLVKRALADDVKILLISVLMLPSALHVKHVVDALRGQNCAAKVVVGGAPFHFDAQLWREVGADAFGETAMDAVKIVHQMMEEIA